jgi:hypothetical protein
MNIDESDAENIMPQQDGDGGGNPGVQSARPCGKRRDPDPAFIEPLSKVMSPKPLRRGKAVLQLPAYLY